MQSLEIRQQINSPLLRFAYNSLGILRHRQGRFAEAEECFQKAVSPNEDYHARVTNHYAEFLIDKGDLGKAENLLRENIAREVKQNGRNHPFYAECLTLLGKCLLKQNRADDA